MLTTFLGMISILRRDAIHHDQGILHSAPLLQTGIGVFVPWIFLFYVFWELMLVPMYS